VVAVVLCLYLDPKPPRLPPKPRRSLAMRETDGWTLLAILG
jgi:hypothetical protein